MAYDATYSNLLKKYVTDPGSYEGSPGFKFALDQAQQAADRAAAATGVRGNGNALAEMMKLATGYASQDYGNTVDRLGRLTGQEEQYDLGQGQLALGNRNADITQQRNSNDYTLGQGQLALGNKTADQNYGLGMARAANDYDLGVRGADNTATGLRYNYDLGRERNSIDASTAQNNFTLGQGRNAIDWYNAQTVRGTAQSSAALGRSQDQRAWYSIYPRQRIAGMP